MSKGWKHTDLVMGEDLVLPDEMFESPKEAKSRMEYCVYAGETDTCLIVEIQYRKAFCSEVQPRVQKHISFAKIWCGEVKIYRRNRVPVTVERENPLDMNIHNGYFWHDRRPRKGKYGI